MTTAEQLIAYYQGLLIAQYANKPKALGTIAALVGGGDGQHGIVADALLTKVRDAFDLDTAVGKQLDFLGEIIGVQRYFFGLDLTKSFVQTTTYGAPDMGTVNGESTYEDPQPPPNWTMTYEDFVQNTLSDADYRRVLKYAAAVRSCDHAYGTLDAILYTFFAGNVNLIITGSMVFTYQHLTTDADGLFEIVNQMGLLPAPAGVTVVVQEVPNY